MKKKAVIITCACVAAALIAGGAAWLIWGRGGKSKSDNAVYVNTVEKLMSLGSGNGMMNRYSGIVESQDTWTVQQNNEKTVKEILVEVGQEVQTGTPLFTYDTEKSQADLDQAVLDAERIANEIESMNGNIAQLQKDKKNAPKENQATLQLQIQEAQLQLKQKEYEAKSKQIEIDKFKQNIANATVTSEIAGVVKSINSGSSQNMDPYGNQDNSFMTILSTGDYKIKGKLNEQNAGALTENMAVIVRSRVDDSITWKGTVTKIDRENQMSNNNNGYAMSSGDNTTQSTSHPFYVTLENSQGLMLGQHVYIEPDNGQDAEPKAGIWLDEYFINDIDSKPYVWADNGKGKLEKRDVTLGQHDDLLFKYEIADGLTKEDAVTFPEAGLEEGMDTAISEDGRMGQSNPPGMEENGQIGTDMDLGGGEIIGGTEGEMDIVGGEGSDGVVSIPESGTTDTSDGSVSSGSVSGSGAAVPEEWGAAK